LRRRNEIDFGLKGKRALVLGASKGIGRGIAAELASEGARVILASRDGEACAAVAEELEQSHDTEVVGASCDMSDLAAVDRIAAFADATFGGIDVLVNNTGGPPFGPVSQVDSQTWQQYFDSMFVSVTRLTGLLLPGMRERGWGRILLVTSTGVIEPIPQLGISNALRIALTNWAKTISLEIAPDGVTINALMPGRIATDRMAQFYQAAAKQQNTDVDTVKSEVAAGIPMGRVGTVEEFAALATFLASERASYITGTTTAIDGGASKRGV
jgi:3-oxoacyl-[acyl-carrier protein] reductase